FVKFKQQYLGLPLDEVHSPRDNSSVSDVSGDLDEFANELDDSDGPLPSIQSSSASEDDEPPLAEVDAGETKLPEESKGVGDPDDSDDSDI
ncbi:hypothetical protein DYB28_008876, partial [Aphanomyces astaci]